ncbi:MAG TPA: ATP-binding cassette domain-containing protein [Bosea sp. (in: a-proteobacteria)]|jgi:branched-chain amino acid transport system ATP-binding protein|uniref:ABC transporter ATP-binding protein n=1 Tax=Bosea sp. (in: a-proteobacteria) TaxID=1871050 RepID=UPI002E0E6C4F|nr:ATP-binding cassette domain-containing protein [Bosea sp. (in: a-proteobacteria)]
MTASSSSLLDVRGLSRRFGAHQVLSDVSFSLGRSEILGLLGPNGSGKSTVLNIVSGFLSADSGVVALDGVGITNMQSSRIARRGLVRTFQLPSMPRRLTVREVIQAGDATSATLAGSLQRFRFDDEVETLIEAFALSAVADQPASSLSGGQKKLLSVATALRCRPQILCLDEPTAGVHPNLRAEMVRILHRYNAQGIAMLVVEHDMLFIRDLCHRCVVLDRGEIIATCAPCALEDDPRVVEAYLGKAVEKGKLSA